jgi:hypothetical protein
MESKDSLMGGLMEANKRLQLVVEEQKRLSGKLFGERPQEASNEPASGISVAALTQRLLHSIAELEGELNRQHSGLGESGQGAQTRAVGY